AGNYLHLTSSQPAGLFPTAHISAADIASAFALIIGDRISDIQRAAFLTLLHSTGKYRQADVIAKCSHHMREAAFVKAGGRPEGNYKGGLVSIMGMISSFRFLDLCDIVGTGGDSHSTFNVSRPPQLLHRQF
ncbi:hypothetical protein N7522_005240, partial [Penicillium canescens]